MSFSEIFSSAFNNTPELMAAESHQQQADAYSDVASSWIADRPSIQLSYYDDAPMGNSGMKEYEYGISLPLWRWGERAASQDFSEKYQSEVDVWKRRLMFDVAGQVRTVLADIAEAEAMLEFEYQATGVAEELLATTTSLFQSGEVARLDVLQVRNLLIAQKKRQLAAEAMMVDAERNYQVLTGLQVRPESPYQENLNSEEEIAADHPQLAFIQNEIAIADGNIKQVERSLKGSPVLYLGSRGEKADQTQSYNESVGVSISIPFGGKSIVSSKSSAARRGKVDIEVRYQNTLRSLKQDLHEVEHELFLVEEALTLSSEQNELSQQRWEMSRSAFTHGELTLAPVILALQGFQTSQKEEKSLLLRKQRLITEFNQITGVLP